MNNRLIYALAVVTVAASVSSCKMLSGKRNRDHCPMMASCMVLPQEVDGV